MKKLILAAILTVISSIAFAESSDMRVLKSSLKNNPNATSVVVPYPSVGGVRLLANVAGARFDWHYGEKANAKLFCKYLGEGWKMTEYEMDDYQYSMRVATLEDSFFSSKISVVYKDISTLEDGEETLAIKLYASVTCEKEQASE